MPRNSIDPIDPVVQRLRQLVISSPELKNAARIYGAILPLLRDAGLHPCTASLTREQALAKMDKGIPLLHDLELDFDGEAIRALMIQLAAAVEKAAFRHKLLRLPWQNGNDSAAGRIRRAIEENRLDIAAFLPQIAVGDTASVTSAAERLGLDPGLLRTLAQNALKPGLRACCRQLSPLVQGFNWNKGDCFVCGAPASLGELQDNSQVKHLRCGSCGADWQFRRMQCMYCGNEEHESQRYLYAEKEKEKTRVEVCDKCRGYLKVIAAFSPTPPELLAVEDLATIHLDYIAQKRGYSRVNVQ